jgi:hypothetical protein
MTGVPVDAGAALPALLVAAAAATLARLVWRSLPRLAHRLRPYDSANRVRGCATENSDSHPNRARRPCPRGLAGRPPLRTDRCCIRRLRRVGS